MRKIHDGGENTYVEKSLINSVSISITNPLTTGSIKCLKSRKQNMVVLFSAAVLLLLPVQDLICISQVCFTSKKWIPHLGWGIVNLVLRILMIMVINMIINGKYLNIIHLISAQMEHPN